MVISQVASPPPSGSPASAERTARDRPAPGRGHLTIDHIADRSRVTRCIANNPLKLLTPDRGGTAAWVYTSTFGGGLLAGDTIDLHLQAGEHTQTVLCTQASTKIYRGDGHHPPATSQSLCASVAEAAVLAVLPDPLVPYADSVYHQLQTFDLAPTAGLVLLDWYSCGRLAMGERWGLTRYGSRNIVRVDGKDVFVDALRLEATPGIAAGDALVVGRFNCFATLVLIGDSMRAWGRRTLDSVAASPLSPQAGRAVTASDIADGLGLVLRVGATSTRWVHDYLRTLLGELTPLLGEHPWSRKW